MPIISIVKSTSSSGKVKYFTDFMQASFHVESLKLNNLSFKLESCLVFFNGDNYYYLTSVNKSECEPGIEKLAPHIPHELKKIDVDHDTAGGQGGYSTTSYAFKTRQLVPWRGEWRDSPVTICIDEKGSIFEIDGILVVEPPSPEYAAIQADINQALEQRVKRNQEEYAHAAELYAQSRESFFAAHKELERKKVELDRQASSLNPY